MGEMAHQGQKEQEGWQNRWQLWKERNSWLLLAGSLLLLAVSLGGGVALFLHGLWCTQNDNATWEVLGLLLAAPATLVVTFLALGKLGLPDEARYIVMWSLAGLLGVLAGGLVARGEI